MRIDNAQLLTLLPRFMRDDRVARALSAAVQPTLGHLAQSIRSMQLYTNPALPEPVLDELAWQRNVLWYDSDAEIDIKRALIQSAPETYQMMGTRGAIERAVADYFGDAAVQEWWEYGGDPYHFRVYTSSEAAEKNGEKLKRIVGLVKRASAIMDGIYVENNGQAELFLAVAALNYEIISFEME